MVSFLCNKLSSYVSFILSKKSLHFLPYGGMQQGVIKASLGYAPVSFSNVLTSSSPSFAVRCGGAIGEMKIYKEPKIYKRGIWYLNPPTLPSRCPLTWHGWEYETLIHSYFSWKFGEISWNLIHHPNDKLQYSLHQNCSWSHAESFFQPMDSLY